MQTVRESIVRAFQSVQAVFEEEDISTLEAKVTAAAPKSPANYAFVIARNWAVTQHRRASFRAKQLAEREHAAAEALRQEEYLRGVREEFRELYQKLSAESTPTQLRYLQTVALVSFSGMSAEEVVARYPGSNANRCYQWKKRGLDLLWPHASPALRTFLSRSTRSQR